MADQSTTRSTTRSDPETERTVTQNTNTQECIDNCTECGRVCLETVIWCLQQGGDHAAPSHIRLLLDCAEICRTSADFMIRGSDFHAQTCGLCADICERCAESCGEMEGETMRRCAEVCRRCVESCRRMAEAGIMESEQSNRS